LTNKKIILDTSVLMSELDVLKEMLDRYTYVITTTVADELDRHKESDSPRLSFHGRMALKFIEQNEDLLHFVVTEDCNALPEDYEDSNDNRILSSVIETECLLATLDRGMLIKAYALGIETIDIGINSKATKFNGYKVLELDKDIEEHSKIFESLYDGTYHDLETDLELSENEYLIIKDLGSPEYELTEDEEIFKGYKTIRILRYSKGKFVKVKLPPEKVIKPLNDLQVCALDLLHNDDCPVKIIAGGFGSGKTMMATKMAVHKVMEKGNYSSIMVLRNPSVEGEPIGFLAGSKAEKTDSFFVPFVQHLENKEYEALRLEQQGILKKEIIGYIKGLSIGSTFIIVDEAEDLNLKQLKMCGSRIEETSAICFIGDYNQTHDKFNYSSGLE